MLKKKPEIFTARTDYQKCLSLLRLRWSGDHYHESRTLPSNGEEVCLNDGNSPIQRPRPRNALARVADDEDCPLVMGFLDMSSRRLTRY